MERVGVVVIAVAAYGLAAGACGGTFEAYKHKIPGLLKIRYIGQTTLLAAAAGGIFLGSGCLLDCGNRYYFGSSFLSTLFSQWDSEEDTF